MTTYTLHTLYLEACSILPSKHRRCFEGSRKGTIGNAIRSRRKMMRPGTRAGYLCFILADQIGLQSVGNVLAGVVKLYAIAGDQLLPENHRNAEIILNHHKITVDSTSFTDHTLKPVKNRIKRICIREIAPKMHHFHGKNPVKHKTTYFPVRNFNTGGYATIICKSYPLFPATCKYNLL